MTKEVKETTTIDAETQPEIPPQDQPVIAITHTAAKLVCEIITICTKRGAFNPNELSLVGTLFEQMNAQLPDEKKVTADSNPTNTPDPAPAEG